MTREEAIAIIRKEYLCVDRDCGIEKNCGKCDLVMPSKEPILEAFKMAIKALEQEPKILEAIDFAIDASNGDTNYFVGFRNGLRYAKSRIDGGEPQFENCAEQQPCEDAISRQTVLEVLKNNRYRFNISQEGCCEGKVLWSENLIKDDACKEIEQLSSVTPTQKIGLWEWVQYDSNPNIGNWHCSECRRIVLHMPEELDNTPTYKWCPICGAKMIEPPESEE